MFLKTKRLSISQFDELFLPVKANVKQKGEDYNSDRLSDSCYLYSFIRVFLK